MRHWGTAFVPLNQTSRWTSPAQMLGHSSAGGPSADSNWLGVLGVHGIHFSCHPMFLDPLSADALSWYSRSLGALMGRGELTSQWRGWPWGGFRFLTDGDALQDV